KAPSAAVTTAVATAPYDPTRTPARSPLLVRPAPWIASAPRVRPANPLKVSAVSSVAPYDLTLSVQQSPRGESVSTSTPSGPAPTSSTAAPSQRRTRTV